MRFFTGIASLLLLTPILAAPSPLADQLAPVNLSKIDLTKRVPAAEPQGLSAFSILSEPAKKHSCYGTRPISCVTIYTEIDWVCKQLSGKAYKLATPLKGSRRVYRVFNGGLVFWEVVPRDSEKELVLSFEDCRREFRWVQDKCAAGTPGAKDRVTYSGWTVHPSGLVMLQMFN